MRNLFFIALLMSNGLMAQLTADQCKEKGNEKIQLNDYDAAMKYYQFGIHQNPSKMEIYNNMGNIYYHYKSYKEAVVYYNKALRLEENNYASLHNRGYCYLNLKKYDKALEDLTAAYGQDETASASFGLSKTYCEMGKYAEALQWIDKAIELDANNYNYYLLKARILDKTVDNRESILIEYDKALSLRPDLPEIYEERAQMLEAWGDNKAAKYDYKTAKGLRKIQSGGENYRSESMIVYL